MVISTWYKDCSLLVKDNDQDTSGKRCSKADDFGLLDLGARSWFFCKDPMRLRPTFLGASESHVSNLVD